MVAGRLQRPAWPRAGGRTSRISRRSAGQDQAQIYQELVAGPPPRATAPQCGHGAAPAGELTTSFLSICSEVKDNRIVPHGYLPLEQRKSVARALGADDDLAEDAGSTAVGGDPDYIAGGGDSLVYRDPLADLPAGTAPAAVQATLYYQAIPPYYLQDRYCTSKSADTQRLYFLAGHLNLEGTAAETGSSRLPAPGPSACPNGPRPPRRGRGRSRRPARGDVARFRRDPWRC